MTRGDRALLAGLLLLTAIIYARIGGFGAIPAWDDAQYIMHRPELTDWLGASWRERLLTPNIGYPIPVPTAMYAFVGALVPATLYVGAVHLLSLFFHLANMLLVFALGRRWFGERAALAAAAIWGLHPICVETVAWATNLKTVTYAFLVLAAMVVWETIVANNKPEHLRKGIVALCLLAAIGCRPEAAIAPAILILQALRVVPVRDVLRRYGLFLGLMLGLGLALALASQLAHSAAMVESDLVDQSFGGRAAAVFVSIGTALSNFVLPLDLQPAYSAPAHPGFLVALPGLTIVAAWGLALVLAIRRRARQLAFHIALPALLYLPYAQLVPLPRMASDTYSYLPGFALVATLVFATHEWKWFRMTAASIACGLCVLTTLQIGRWEDGVTLWEPMIAVEPTTARPYRQTAFAYWQRGDSAQAAAILEVGRAAFRLQRSYPFWAPLVFESLGRPVDAANLATEAFLTDRAPQPQHAKVFIEVLARTNVALPADEAVQNAIGMAAKMYLEHPEWLASNDADLAIATYLVTQDAAELAVPFLRNALSREPVRCRAWRVAQMLEQNPFTSPADCGD